MKISPVRSTTEPRYPSRHRVFAALGRWARRSAGAAVASSALVFGACYGATPIGTDDPPVETDDPVDPRIITDDDPPGPFGVVSIRDAGVAMAPSFQCAPTRPEPPAYIEGWGYWEGAHCGEETGWAFFEVIEEAAGTYRLSIDWGAEAASVALLGPEGEEVAYVDLDEPSVDLDLSAGLWTLSLTAVDPTARVGEWVTVSLNRLY